MFDRITNLSRRLDDAGQPDVADRLDRIAKVVLAEKAVDPRTLSGGPEAARAAKESIGEAVESTAKNAGDWAKRLPGKFWRTFKWLTPLAILGGVGYDALVDRPTEGNVMPQAPPGSTFDPQFQMQDIMQEIMRNSYVYAQPETIPAGTQHWLQQQYGQPNVRQQEFGPSWANEMVSPQPYGGWPK